MSVAARKDESGLKSTVEHVVLALRDRIKTGMLMPGQRLVEADITSDFGVSRSSVREALRRLAAEGLVEIKHQRGARVRQMTRKDVIALYDIREVLEGLAARRAAEHFKAAGRKGELDAILDDLAMAEKTGAFATFAECNTRFHDFLVDLADNPPLADLIKTLHTPIVRFQFRSMIDLSAIKESNRDHTAIARAVKKGDGDGADAAMRSHVRRSAASIMTMPDTYFAAG